MVGSIGFGGDQGLELSYGQAVGQSVLQESRSERERDLEQFTGVAQRKPLVHGCQQVRMAGEGDQAGNGRRVGLCKNPGNQLEGYAVFEQNGGYFRELACCWGLGGIKRSEHANLAIGKREIDEGTGSADMASAQNRNAAGHDNRGALGQGVTGGMAKKCLVQDGGQGQGRDGLDFTFSWHVPRLRYDGDDGQ